MQYKVKNWLLALCVLQALHPEALVGAQDTTTPKSDNAEKETFPPNTADNEENAETTVLIPGSCSESCKTQSNNNYCQCNCSGDSLQEFCNQLNSFEGSGDEERTTIISSNDEETTTVAPEIPTNPPSNSAETTISESDEPTEQKTPPSFNCTTVGVFPDPNNCHQYHNCTQVVGGDTIEATLVLCPKGLAFNAEFSKCMRDLSPCSAEHGGFECSQPGSFPDPNNDTSLYYRCVPHLDGKANGYHKYVVSCGKGRIFIPGPGKCLVDFNTIGNNPAFNINPYEQSDEQIVKTELKQWKIKEKNKLKEEKNRLKMAEKQQKELAKKQAKEAKEKAKAEKKMKKEQNSFDSAEDIND